MTYSATELQTLGQTAARGAGFPPAQAESFGRALAVHLAAEGDPQILMGALENPADSPILRLPLLMNDLQRAFRTLGSQVSISLSADDAALAPAYMRTLPRGLSDLRIERRAGAPAMMHVTAAPEDASPDRLPERIAAPETLIANLRTLAVKTQARSGAPSRPAGAGVSDNG